jgi:hypothetical protein
MLEACQHPANENQDVLTKLDRRQVQELVCPLEIRTGHGTDRNQPSQE